LKGQQIKKEIVKIQKVDSTNLTSEISQDQILLAALQNLGNVTCWTPTEQKSIGTSLDKG